MFFRLFALTVALLAGTPTARGANPSGELSELKLSQLEQRLTEIDAELEQLAKMSLRSGVGSIGYRSRGYDSPNTPISVEVELEHEVPVDEVVLVPTLWRDSEKGFQADGFPASFRIIAKSTQHPEGTVLANIGPGSGILPRIAPLVIPVASTPATHIVIEVSELSIKSFDQKYGLQLAEVLVFSGTTNVALRRPINLSLSPREPLREVPWHPRFLVDGHMPYLMDAASGEKSIAYINQFNAPSTITVDLLESPPITSIHLHAVDQSDTVPQAHPGDLGIPRHLKVEGANQADFSDAVTLLQTNAESLSEMGPIMMWNIPEAFCRYVQLTEVDPPENFRIGFAEIELFSDGRNVALGKPTSLNKEINPGRDLKALTDGRNLYGEILPIRTWMQQLARRHDLESERPFVTQELSRRYAQQKANMRRISWLAATLLFIIIIIVIMLEQIARQRAISRTRERIAANLHDELGANLHAIGLLGDFAKKIVARKNAQDEWAELAEVIDEVRTLTEETGETARYCTNMLETKEIHANLIAEMKRTADRLLTDLSYHLDFPEDENSLQELKPRRRIDLYLFYKECLTNILRHSSASHVSTQLTATSNNITLTISDNGQGLVDRDIPKSLRRRARLLGGRVNTENLATGGLQITLQLHPRRRRRLHRN